MASETGSLFRDFFCLFRSVRFNAYYVQATDLDLVKIVDTDFGVSLRFLDRDLSCLYF